MSNLLHNVRLSDEQFAVGQRDNKPQVRFVPESDYIELRDQCRNQIREAQASGYSDGLKAGLARGQEEARRICNEFQLLISDVKQQRSEIYRLAELEVVELARAIASRIISAEVDSRPEIVMDAARKAVRLLRDRSNLVLKVSPEQEQFIRDNLDRLYQIDDSIRKIEIDTDRRVGIGGCILETESGNVDARIETELANIAHALKMANLKSDGE